MSGVFKVLSARLLFFGGRAEGARITLFPSTLVISLDPPLEAIAARCLTRRCGLASVQTMNNHRREEELTLELLQVIESESGLTQRHLAKRLGVALGLTNSYLKRCVRKGLVKIQEAPANRYLYYLTPKGFAEKTRLTGEYLSYSLSFYRRASDSCAEVLGACEVRGWRRVMLCGAGDLAEIAALRASVCDLEVTAIFDADSGETCFAGVPVVDTLDPQAADAWIVTALRAPQSMVERVEVIADAERVLVPSVLGLSGIRGDIHRS